MAALEARYKIAPAGLTGEQFVIAVAEKHCVGDVERAGRKMLVRSRRACARNRTRQLLTHNSDLRHRRRTIKRVSWACLGLTLCRGR